MQHVLFGCALKSPMPQGLVACSTCATPPHAWFHDRTLHQKVWVPNFKGNRKATHQVTDWDPCSLLHPSSKPQTKYYNALKSLQAKQLGAVLTYLAPANALPLWAVDVTASEAGTTATNAANAAKKPEPATAAKATTTTTAAASAAPKVTSNHYTTDKAGNPTKPATAAAAATTTTATSATNN